MKKTIVVRGREQTVVIKDGRFQSYITPDQWKAMWLGIAAMWVTLWLGILIGMIYSGRNI